MPPAAVPNGDLPMTGDHDHTDPPSNETLRVKALESLLVEKGLRKHSGGRDGIDADPPRADWTWQERLERSGQGA